MVTTTALSIYERYRGDEDYFVIAAPPADKAAMPLDAWSRISEWLTHLRNLEAGVLSEEYAKQIRDTFESEIPVASIRAALARLAVLPDI